MTSDTRERSQRLAEEVREHYRIAVEEVKRMGDKLDALAAGVPSETSGTSASVKDLLDTFAQFNLEEQVRFLSNCIGELDEEQQRELAKQAFMYRAADGKEAEELRSEIEAWLEGCPGNGRARKEIQNILDKVDARDSLRHLTDTETDTFLSGFEACRKQAVALCEDRARSHRRVHGVDDWVRTAANESEKCAARLREMAAPPEATLELEQMRAQLTAWQPVVAAACHLEHCWGQSEYADPKPLMESVRRLPAQFKP